MENIAKCLIFIIGLVLIRYVGGIPEDSNNFFIAQFIFFATFLVDYFKYITIENIIIKTLSIIGFIAGIIVIVLNILGIMGIIIIGEINNVYLLMFNKDYYMGISNISTLYSFMNVTSIVYIYVFFSKLVFENRLIENEKNKEKGVVSNVHAG